MSDWSLPQIFSSLNGNLEKDLAIGRATLAHSVEKGNASEKSWCDVLKIYLPERYRVTSGHVVDSKNNFSQQIDVIIFDRHYTPFIFEHNEEKVIPAESVYAVFEVKQSIDLDEIKYAQQKIGSVRKLHRTSIPIPHAGGEYEAKLPLHILGGILALDSGWGKPLGAPLKRALNAEKTTGRLDLGCVARHGMFEDKIGEEGYTMTSTSKPAAAFLFKLITRLQEVATVPMIDIGAYSRWLEE